MNAMQQLNQFGAIHVKEVIGKDLIEFFSHCLMRASFYQGGKKDDNQVKGAVGILDHEVMFETLQERIWPAIENILGEELIPTYSYSRLYTNGNVLEKHTDRPSCEISLTVQLARSHHYAWPIYMGNKRFDLGEGEGVIYKGCDVEHWRNPCDGPEGYLSGQAFFHFVRKNGFYSEFANDKRWEQQSNVYDKTRNFIWRNK